MIKSRQSRLSLQTGAILILVLIILSSSTLLVMYVFEQNLIGARLLGFVNRQFQEWNDFENHLEPVARHPVFVPDHLGFGCQEGDWIFEEKNNTMHRIWGMAWSDESPEDSTASKDPREYVEFLSDLDAL